MRKTITEQESTIAILKEQIDEMSSGSVKGDRMNLGDQIKSFFRKKKSKAM